jgi:hypothetical protein
MNCKMTTPSIIRLSREFFPGLALLRLLPAR